MDRKSVSKKRDCVWMCELERNVDVQERERERERERESERVCVVMSNIIARDCPFVEKGLIAFVFFRFKTGSTHTGVETGEGSFMKLGVSIQLNLFNPF